jgi:hypothetical protein
LLGETPEPRSLKPVSAPAIMPDSLPPGSFREFGFGVLYTVVSHKIDNGKTYAVVTSRESNIETWTTDPTVVAMADGDRFMLNRSEERSHEAPRSVSLTDR